MGSMMKRLTASLALALLGCLLIAGSCQTTGLTVTIDENGNLVISGGAGYKGAEDGTRSAVPVTRDDNLRRMRDAIDAELEAH